MTAKAWVMTFDKKTSEININPLITCADCKYCKMSDLEGFWHCDAWDKELNADVYKMDTFFCGEGEKECDQ